ncbi:MAG: amidohydrolase [candidate division WOR-3 bacterium]|nr:amidohydrolase [candidate division WOR-3 bacterium]
MFDLPSTYIIEAQRIYTMDEENQSYCAMLVDNGRIKTLFAASPLLSLPKIEFSSYFIVPGFIDSHTHILLYGLQKIFPDLSDAQSIAEILEIIAAHQPLTQQVGFLFCYNFEPEKIKERRYIYKDEIDRIGFSYPIIIFRADMHSASVNSAALKLLPQSDKFSFQTGILKGNIYEYTYKTFLKFISPDLRLKAFRITLNDALASGITTLVTMLGSEEDSESCELLVENLASFPIEVVPFYQTQNINRVKKLGLKRIGGCILIDGSFGSHTAAIFDNYNDEPHTNGILYLSDQELENFFKAAESEGLQTAVHAIGDRAIDQVVRVWEKIIKSNTYRHRIEHCELLNDTLIQRIKDLGLLVSAQPAFEYFWGGPEKLYAIRLGERWRSTNHLAKLISHGIKVLGGSDAPVTPLNPLLGIKSAVYHPNPEARISILDAMKMFSVNGAYGIFAENRIGALKLNYEANFIVLEKDPLATVDNTVVSVFYRGKKVFTKN